MSSKFSDPAAQAGGFDGDEDSSMTRMPRLDPGELPQRRASRKDKAGRPAARPLYLQVKDHLIRRVLTGEWRPGECLPSEMKLADEYDLSQGTVRKAIEELAVEGLVTRHAGRGTFVTSHKGDYQPFRFHRFFLNNGVRIAGGELVYVACRKAEASSRAAAGLQVAPGAPVSEIVRLRCHEGRPVLLETTTLGAELCPGAEAVLAQQKPDSIYLTLEQTYNLLIVRVDEHLRARIVEPKEAELLELPSGTAILEAERIAYSLGGEPVEWRISVCHTDDLSYRNRIG